MTIRLSKGLSVIACYVMTMAYLAPVNVSASPSLRRSGCVSELQDVFKEPVRFDGKRLCAVAYVVNQREFLGFYPTERMARVRPLDVVLVLSAEGHLTDRMTRVLHSLEKVYLTGTLKVDRECILPNADPDMIMECHPVLKPIYLTNSRVRVMR